MSTLGRFRNSFYAEPACNVFTSYRLTAHPCISRRRPFPLFSHFHPHNDTAIAVELQGDKRGKVVKFDTAVVFFPNVSVLIRIHFHSKHLLKRFLQYPIETIQGKGCQPVTKKRIHGKFRRHQIYNSIDEFFLFVYILYINKYIYLFI